MNNELVVHDPAYGVVQQPQQITVASEPITALNVSRKVGRAAGAYFAKNNCWLIGVGGRRVCQLRWIPDEAWNHGEYRILHGFERDAILRAGEPVCVAEAVKDRVLALDAGIVGIARGANNISGFDYAE